MALSSLDHFLVRTGHLDGTKKFYTEILGLEVGWRAPFPFPGYWLYLGGVPCVHLVGVGEDAARKDYLGEEETGRASQSGTGAIDHLGFRATDLTWFMRHFEENGIKYRKRSVEGLVQVFIEDPNGITIELNFDASTEEHDQAARDTSV